MPINPLQFAQGVNEQFLNYQLTATPITDPDLSEQARSILKGTTVGGSPLIKGPYVSLSKSFLFADKDLHELAAEGKIHPALPGIAEYPTLFSHQGKTLNAVMEGNHCLVATGTGSGKTEAFLYPILDHCLKLRDADAPDGVVAIIVYPMNALAIDQLNRLRRLLAGTKITFGLYVGSTPADDSEVSNVEQMKEGEGREAFEAYEKKYRRHENMIITPWEDRLTERQMAEKPPRILLTNSNQLELLLTRGKDIGMFVGAPLKFLVFDEAHTYSGASGAEVACLIRRIRSFCGKKADDVICIGTSATVTDPERGEEAGTHFAHRFFGIDPEKVVLVKEEYQEEEWPKEMYVPEIPSGDPDELINEALEAIDGDGDVDVAKVQEVISKLSGHALSVKDNWRESLYDELRRNEYVRLVYHFLGRPKHIREAVQRINTNIKRAKEPTESQGQAELMVYLLLGAVAEKDGNTLLRPKVHYFVKGLEGGCVVLNEKEDGTAAPKFYLSPESASERNAEREPTAILPISVCKTCGQHYYSGWYSDFRIENGEAVGGMAENENVVWEPVGEENGTRIVFTDRFISEIEDEEEAGDKKEATKKLDKKRFVLYICRFCGAVHKEPGSECEYEKCRRPFSLLPVQCVSQLGKISNCPSCGQRGKKIGEEVKVEPIKPMQAITVADVHILAQNIVNALPEEFQKLIVFTDNRQDAAFQAGWMQDHARRYRLRHLIYDFLEGRETPTSVSDIQDYLMSLFGKEKALARALAPEVFSGKVVEAFGKNIEKNLKYYVRIALIRELATSFKQRDSLETWGVSKVIYHGITEKSLWIKEWSDKLGMNDGELCEGISCILDSLRRNNHFYDQDAPIFSQWWHESSEEVQRGYLPFFDFPPKGLKYTRGEKDKNTYVTQFQSDRGVTFVQEFISKWKPEQVKKEAWSSLQFEFIKDLWKFLTEELEVLEPVTLKGPKGGAIGGTSGVYQVSSKSIGIVTQRERYKCNICQRIHTRPSPNGGICTARYCKGNMVREEPPVDDYNIALLGMPFSMLTAQEHSAQVPPKVREKIENDFKKTNGGTNCLVATPTLEMGIDIGDLDMILMRNVPPKPSNYWQRAGRAGRRFRMAVVFSYCRRSQHDSYFFDAPERMLDGLIETPRFNLLNEVMLRKHVHATVLSELIRLANPEYTGNKSISGEDADQLEVVRREVFPTFINTYLFQDGREYRTVPYDTSVLKTVIKKYFDHFHKAVKDVFTTYWPEEAKKAISGEILYQYIEEMPDRLQETVNRLHNRMMWAVHTRQKLVEREKKGLLDKFEERLRRRCMQYLENLIERKSNTYTLSVLATEGLLPGYGTYEGGVTAFAGKQSMVGTGKFEFELPRPSSIAVREFVPGNMIYANSGRFKTVLFHFPVGEKQIDPEEYILDLDRNVLSEKKNKDEGESYGEVERIVVSGLPICDVDIAYISRISDDEVNRFQLPVNIVGYRKKAHSGGDVYKLGDRIIKHIRGQEVRLVNVGPADRVKRGLIGYPICTVCGGARSPYAYEKELEHFREFHQKRCGKEPGNIGVFADTKVDVLIVPGFAEKDDAINVGEGIRMGAQQVLEMASEDVQIIILGEDGGGFELFLYDPMPGGSGLLNQIMEKWKEVVLMAGQLLSSCPNACKTSCYGCMRSYRNIFHHQLLDRIKAISLMEVFSIQPQFEYDIQPEAEEKTLGDPSGTNKGEDRLAEMLLKAGFPSYLQGQKVINLGKPYKQTTPDFYFDDIVQEVEVAVYLDGLSKAIHGNTERAKVDRVIRQQLEAEGISVIEIANSDLNDPEIMLMHFKRLAHALKRKDHAASLKQDGMEISAN